MRPHSGASVSLYDSHPHSSSLDGLPQCWWGLGIPGIPWRRFLASNLPPLCRCTRHYPMAVVLSTCQQPGGCKRYSYMHRVPTTLSHATCVGISHEKTDVRPRAPHGADRPSSFGRAHLPCSAGPWARVLQPARDSARVAAGPGTWLPGLGTWLPVLLGAARGRPDCTCLRAGSRAARRADGSPVLRAGPALASVAGFGGSGLQLHPAGSSTSCPQGLPQALFGLCAPSSARLLRPGLASWMLPSRRLCPHHPAGEAEPETRGAANACLGAAPA